jgi:hypothetical protein
MLFFPGNEPRRVRGATFAPTQRYPTFYARSADPSAGFEANIQVTDGHGSATTDFLGDYKGIAVQGADVLVVWQDTRRDTGDIYFAKAVGAAGP